MTNSSELWDKKQKKKRLDVGSLCPELCLPGGSFLSVLPCENKALFLNFRSMSLTHLLLIVMEGKIKLQTCWKKRLIEDEFQSGSVRKQF